MANKVQRLIVQEVLLVLMVNLISCDSVLSSSPQLNSTHWKEVRQSHDQHQNVTLRAPSVAVKSDVSGEGGRAKVKPVTILKNEFFRNATTGEYKLE